MPRAKGSVPLLPQHQQHLAALQSRFEAFRRSTPPRARIPHELRAAALDALRGGMSATDLCRACGVTRGQLTCWQTGRSQGQAHAHAHRGDRVLAPKILSVIDRETVPSVADGVEWEVRVGSWRLSVRISPDPGQRH